MYIIRLCLFHPRVLSLLTHLFNYIASQDLAGDFSMHFVNVFLNSSYPYILAQGGVTVSVFGTTVFVMYMTSPPPPNITFLMHSAVCQSVQTDTVFRKTKHDCFFIWKVKKMLNLILKAVGITEASSPCVYCLSNIFLVIIIFIKNTILAGWVMQFYMF